MEKLKTVKGTHDLLEKDFRIIDEIIGISEEVSRSFNFEINAGKTSNNSNIENKYFNEYIGADLYNLRFGGKAILINQNEYFPISSGIRMTFGRSLFEKWPGYLFIENVNTRNFSKRIKFNVAHIKYMRVCLKDFKVLKLLSTVNTTVTS